MMTTSPRFFNRIQRIGDEVKKSSSKKEKIFNEFFHYYALSPGHKKYLVRPYSFTSEPEEASYLMKDYGQSDAGWLYANNHLTIEILFDILESVNKFYSFSCSQDLDATASYYFLKKFIIDKTDQRLIELYKSTDGEFDFLGSTIFKRLSKAFERISEKVTISISESHGDLCLSNILVCDDSKIRFIDPRGLDSLWLDPNYDIAKLSQSILGGYDFILNGTVPGKESENIKKYFIKFLNENKIDLNLIMLYQASLFLSMCPLHIDSHERIYLFLDAASKSLDEIGF